MTPQIRILIVDDERLIRSALAAILAAEADFEVIGQAADGLEALELVEQLDPDVVLMDVSMPRMDGTRATRLITSACPGVKVIGLSMHDDDWMARTMLEAGASGYLEKAAELDTLIDTIRDVAQDQFAAAGG